ncbi:cytochrome c [Ruegeria sediminis]|uniref:Cytochrome c n=1 Tax=Ruegeria sediminis TaxID=2583820 RepID=A0ABY2WYG1_9RHOB|nr:cytochrome c [Ruegeria sediminis]TMV07886.1 cytochrome c [Ruegeria sediminis]
MRTVFGKLQITALALAAVWASPLPAQDAERGAEIYRHHCATCHGLDASGNGPMAAVLVVQPKDLTTLQGEDGVFPTERVVFRIDGRDPLVSHGSAMPIYGPYFEGNDIAIKTPAGQPILTSEPIADLVAYLQTIQGS